MCHLKAHTCIAGTHFRLNTHNLRNNIHPHMFPGLTMDFIHRWPCFTLTILQAGEVVSATLIPSSPPPPKKMLNKGTLIGKVYILIQKRWNYILANWKITEIHEFWKQKLHSNPYLKHQESWVNIFSPKMFTHTAWFCSLKQQSLLSSTHLY